MAKLKPDVIEWIVRSISIAIQFSMKSKHCIIKKALSVVKHRAMSRI